MLDIVKSPANAPPPMALKRVVKTYGAGGANSPVVLDGIDLTIADGEIVAILGQSGCGKSTLLRIIAGLVPASHGEVLYRGRPVTEPMPGIAMVFQSFALFPWMTVLENVSFGLEAQGVGASERRKRAVKAIDLIGLDGYENAYPKELSGGMRQRVGFARALVVEPDLLLLDEPFSALDVLTAEILRGDLMDLWTERKISTRGIVFISHNIQEAVEVSDRIIVMSPHPGRISADFRIDIPHPRDRESEEFKKIVDDIYHQLAVGMARAPVAATQGPQVGISFRLPAVGVQPMLGLIDAINYPPYDGTADLADLAESESLEMDRLMALVQGLELLRFITLSGMTVSLTREAFGLHEADIQDRKRIFQDHLMKHVPLIRHMHQILKERQDSEAPEDRFISELQDHVSRTDAVSILETAINWGRFAELFTYDYDSGLLGLDSGDDQAEK
ncbi:MAG TPA: nitrate/sulfonate/bicarbonate ABC transporter ATP-binding protein [Rhodospirillaceae bacterium]|nr:nitrate/sulfonate/bicarbonate ABC transporter ATP-binding protein [Rhodospirillaceae bacterium]